MLSHVKTPFYIIDEKRLENNYFSMKQSFQKKFENLIIGYSFKTNSLPWILNWMRKKGAYAEVVSEEEYELALKVGYEDKNIIFNGPVKGSDMLQRALDSAAIVNLDSFSEIDWISKNIPENQNIKIGLRVNFDLENVCPNESMMGEEPGRFGFNVENGSFDKALKALEKMKNVKVTGLHLHNSTKTKSLKVFTEISKKAGKLAGLLKDKIEYIDIGGGFFGDKPGAPTFDEYARCMEKIKDYINIKNITLIIEPGAALIASPISFVCEAVDIKEVKGKKIITTDGSCHNINPAMSGVKFMIDTDSQEENIVNEQIICGYTCIEKDRMAVLKKYKEIKKRNRIIFYNTGSYSMSLSPLFIKYYPAVIVKSTSDKYFYAREKWSVEEYINKCFFDNEKEV